MARKAMQFHIRPVSVPGDNNPSLQKFLPGGAVGIVAIYTDPFPVNRRVIGKRYQLLWGVGMALKT